MMTREAFESWLIERGIVFDFMVRASGKRMAPLPFTAENIDEAYAEAARVLYRIVMSQEERERREAEIKARPFQIGDTVAIDHGGQGTVTAIDPGTGFLTVKETCIYEHSFNPLYARRTEKKE